MHEFGKNKNDDDEEMNKINKINKINKTKELLVEYEIKVNNV